MQTIKGPGLFLAQFVGAEPPFDTFDGLAGWAAECGYRGVQVPTFETGLIDLDEAARSPGYCDAFKGRAQAAGVEVTELAAHMQGQLVAVHPAYDTAFDGFAPAELHGNPGARQDWAVDQLRKTIDAAANMGLGKVGTFSGALAWPFLYPWPQRPPGLIEEAFDELARRWRPIFDHAEERGVDVCFELHPGEDLHDGVTFEMLLERVDNHPRCRLLYDPSHFVLQGMDYLQHIDIYAERISMFHVKDAEFRPDGRQGVYGGYQGWTDRAGRFRSPGDGQVDFGAVFSKLTTQGFDGWAVVEWECALKHPEDGAREGAAFTSDHIIRVTDRAFDDFAGGGSDPATNRKMLGLDQ